MIQNCSSGCGVEEHVVRPIGSTRLDGAVSGLIEDAEELEASVEATCLEHMKNPKGRSRGPRENTLAAPQLVQTLRARRGREAPHKRSFEIPTVPEVHLDIICPGGEHEDSTLTVPVAWERISKMAMASVTPSKSSGEFLAKRVVALLREIGREHCEKTIKSVQEPAIVALVTDIGRLRAASGGRRMVVEHSPVYSSQSNGSVERALQAVQQQLRVMRSALEERWCVRLHGEDRAWPWISEYAAWLLDRAEVGHDGKTSYERAKCKRARVAGVELGQFCDEDAPCATTWASSAACGGADCSWA